MNVFSEIILLYTWKHNECPAIYILVFFEKIGKSLLDS